MLTKRSLKLGEALAGDLIVKSLYKFSFNHADTNKALCRKRLSAEDVNSFIVAIEQRYAYELLVDNLPMRLFVGELTNNGVYLYTHLDFALSINDANIVQASALPGNAVPLVEDKAMDVEFTYSVVWKKVSATRRTIALHAATDAT